MRCGGGGLGTRLHSVEPQLGISIRRRFHSAKAVPAPFPSATASPGMADLARVVVPLAAPTPAEPTVPPATVARLVNARRIPASVIVFPISLPYHVEAAAYTACSVSNQHGICLRTPVCTGNGLTSCDAATPEAEVCDGLDNNGDGAIDENACASE